MELQNLLNARRTVSCHYIQKRVHPCW